MTDLPDSLLFEGVSIDLSFGRIRPTFGDLCLLTGEPHPRFPPSGEFAFQSLSHLQFDQVEDYFGVRSLTDVGDDVAVWLYPLVRDRPMDHHPGPFEGLRLNYNVFRNPVRRIEHYLRCVTELSRFAAGAFYRTRKVELGIPLDLNSVRADIDAVVNHWRQQGIEVGSDEAMDIDY